MYTTEFKLKDNESPAKINKETGELTELKNRPNNMPEGKQVFEPDTIFKKDYTVSWSYLKANLSHLELSAAIGLSLLAKANTNSLEPINDKTALSDLSELLGISKNKISKVLDKLFKYGVYGKFEVHNITKPYTKYWILNPYLSFSGKLISSDIAALFNDTLIAHNFRNPINGRIPPTTGTS